VDGAAGGVVNARPAAGAGADGGIVGDATAAPRVVDERLLLLLWPLRQSPLVVVDADGAVSPVPNERVEVEDVPVKRPLELDPEVVDAPPPPEDPVAGAVGVREAVGDAAGEPVGEADGDGVDVGSGLGESVGLAVGDGVDDGDDGDDGDLPWFGCSPAAAGWRPSPTPSPEVSTPVTASVPSRWRRPRLG
jgi:hypothetical protein